MEIPVVGRSGTAGFVSAITPTRNEAMKTLRKLVVVAPYYPPDRNTTAAIFSSIAEHLAVQMPVLVLSGTAGSSDFAHLDRLSVVEIKNWTPAKRALFRRIIADAIFTIRVFFTLIRTLKGQDAVLTVTGPSMMPYAVAIAAKLKGARSALIIHDLYPDALVVAGVVGAKSLAARMVRAANLLMFRTSDRLVIIGRDTERLLARYDHTIRERIALIPNWTTLVPGVRPIDSENPYRRSHPKKFIIGLSGNLGFTHDPLIVFEAALRMKGDENIHFLLSGWGVGFEQLKMRQAEARLSNVTIVEKVEDEDLDNFLAAADVWTIPYRKRMLGVSTPSRFYNLLAVGRPVIVISEPEAEAAWTVWENNVGWVVMPGRVDELVSVFRKASVAKDVLLAERAVSVAKDFTLDRAMRSYATLMNELLQDP